MSKKVIVYIPPGAEINVENQPMASPKVKYEKRKQIFNVGIIKKLTGGKYGKSDNNNS